MTFMAPFDALWFIEGHEYWARDVDIKCHLRTASNAPAFVGWHNVEIFELPRAERHKHYVIVPVCWALLEPPGVLLVPLPSVFAYYLGVVVVGLAHSCIL